MTRAGHRRAPAALAWLAVAPNRTARRRRLLAVAGGCGAAIAVETGELLRSPAILGSGLLLLAAVIGLRLGVEPIFRQLERDGQWPPADPE